MPPLTNHEGAP